MGHSIRITVGDVQLTGTLNDTPTADKIWDALPIDRRVNVWGSEFYFDCGVSADQAPDATDRMEVGTLAYWPPGTAFCIFFGPTPASTGSEPRMASLGNIFGKLDDVPVARLQKIRSGTAIKIEQEE